MRRLVLITLSLALVLPLGAQSPQLSPQREADTRHEHWLYNARERTARGLEAHTAEDPAFADEAFAAAHRLAEGHPTTLYNAGTSRLAVDPEGSARLLEQAVTADPTTADMFYNLGNARLAAADAHGAIEAFQSALRVDPGHRDAKFNLEWALRKLEEEEQSGEDDSEEEQEQQQDEQEQEEQEQEQQQPPPQENDPNAEPQEQNAQNSPLPQFHDLPDMTAAEAAEILEAVENLEREERRRRAMESVRTSTRELEDW